MAAKFSAEEWLGRIEEMLRGVLTPGGGTVNVTVTGTTSPLSGARTGAATTTTIANGAALSTALDMSTYALGTLHMPAAWTAASIGFYVSAALAGTYQPLYDDLGVLVQIPSPAVNKSYQLPAALAGCRFVKLWSQNGSGTDTNQSGADRILGVDLKA